MSKDLSITRFVNLEFSPDSNSTTNGLYIPQLTPSEITNIPTTPDRFGSVVFNTQSQELVTLTAAQQWLNVITDQGEPVFSTMTVTGDLISTEGTIIGDRPGGSYYTSTPVSVNLTSTPIKIPNITTGSYTSHGFTMSANNQLQYTPGSDYPATIGVNVKGIVNLTTIGAGATYIAYLYKNGGQISTTDGSARATATAGHPIVLSFSSYQTLVANDYLEIWMSSSATSNSNFAICSMNVIEM